MAFFSGLNCFIVPNLLGKSKAELFVKRLKEFGGSGEIFGKKVELSNLSRFTHIIVDSSVSYPLLHKILGDSLEDTSRDVRIVTSKWLTLCLERKSLVDSAPFQIDRPAENSPHELLSYPNSLQPSKKAQLSETKDDIEVGPSNKYPKIDNSTKDSQAKPEDKLPPRPVSFNTTKFICMKSSKEGTKVDSGANEFNAKIIAKLQEMAEAYKSTKDKWRAFSYEKAIIALKCSSQPIDSYEKARNLPSVGKSLAEKIGEIASSGDLEKLKVLQSSETLHSVQLFMRIWGVGVETANLWANQGHKSLDDVREKVALTTNQKIGLKYFDEFDERMSREEVAEIESVVKVAVKSIDPRLEMVTCGSYRRGKATCGDVDILITHADGSGHVGVFNRLLSALREQKFLTEDLTIFPNMKGGMAKYLGVCKLPGPQSKHRRLDIIVTPYSQYGCCLVYFTGSAHFNRSMRLLADKMGMSLTEHALYKDVLRGPNKEIIHHGVQVYTPTEESVFQHLGVPYRKPEERDHE